MVLAGWEIFAPRASQVNKKVCRRHDSSLNVDPDGESRRLSEQAFKKCWSTFCDEFNIELVSQLAVVARYIRETIQSSCSGLPVLALTSPISDPLKRLPFESALRSAGVSDASLKFVYMSSKDLYNIEGCARVLIGELTQTHCPDDSEDVTSDDDDMGNASSRKVNDLSTLVDWVQYTRRDESVRCMLVVEVADEANASIVADLITILSEIRESCSPKLSFCVIVEGLSSPGSLSESLDLITATKVEFRTVEIFDLKKLQDSVCAILEDHIPMKGFGFSCDSSNTIIHHSQSAEALMKFAFFSLRHFYKTHPLSFLCDPDLISEATLEEVIVSSRFCLSKKNADSLKSLRNSCVTEDSQIDPCKLLARETFKMKSALATLHTLNFFRKSLHPELFREMEQFFDKTCNSFPITYKHLNLDRRKDLKWFSRFLKDANDEIRKTVMGLSSPYVPPETVLR